MATITGLITKLTRKGGSGANFDRSGVFSMQDRLRKSIAKSIPVIQRFESMSKAITNITNRRFENTSKNITNITNKTFPVIQRFGNVSKVITDITNRRFENTSKGVTNITNKGFSNVFDKIKSPVVKLNSGVSGVAQPNFKQPNFKQPVNFQDIEKRSEHEDGRSLGVLREIQSAIEEMHHEFRAVK